MSSFNSKRRSVLTPTEAMALAIREARNGGGFVAPNPLVGCVILDREGKLVSSGFHKQYGGDHAEIEALKGLSEDQLEAATLYVTLEPCAHEGKTPSCAKKIANLPLAAVYYGLIDPNPLVRGKGVEIIRAAGIKCEEFQELKEELEELPEIFLHNQLSKKPFVALKVASSMDGQMGLKTGDSKWITNEKSREYAHYLRGIYDAILVGRRTILIDDPSLNVRHPHFKGKSNRVVILDPLGDILKSVEKRNIMKAHKAEDVFFVVSKKAALPKLETSIQLIPVDFSETDGFKINEILEELYARGICSLLLEGGAYVYQTFLTQWQVQRLYHFQAPIILGAQSGLPWTQGVSINSMSERLTLEHVRTLFFDNDVLVTGRLKKS